MTAIDGLTGGVAGLALASALVWAGRRCRTDAELLFAVFCASLAMALLRPALGEAPGAVQVLVTLGGCATCNAYWLVARALFRGDGAVRSGHLAAAGVIAVMILAYRAAERSGTGLGAAVIGDLLTLASSTVLVLAFVEACRGFGDAGRDERRLRIAFMGVYGVCVLLGTTLSALAPLGPAWAEAKRFGVLGCASAILLFTHLALVFRRRWQVASKPQAGAMVEVPDALPLPVQPTADDIALADALRQAMRKHALYRQPELKVADLALAVGSVEHKVSRAITQGLGERNFNRWVNRLRIEHACGLLEADDARTVLEIAFDSGFASLGPFNRAFKAETSLTPSAWRASRMQAGATPSPPLSRT